MTVEEYSRRFAIQLAKHYNSNHNDQSANKYALAVGKARFEALICDPEGDAGVYFEDETHDPVELLTRRYHEALRALLMEQAREEIRNSI